MNAPAAVASELVDPPLHPLDRVPGRGQVVEPLTVLFGMKQKVRVPGASGRTHLLVLAPGDYLLGEAIDSQF